MFLKLEAVMTDGASQSSGMSYSSGSQYAKKIISSLQSNRVVEIWNALPCTVVAASSSNVFKRMFDCGLCKIVSIVLFSIVL